MTTLNRLQRTAEGLRRSLLHDKKQKTDHKTSVIKKVIARSKHEDDEIISSIVLREKPDGSFILILNLKKLNENIDKKNRKWRQ